MRIDRTPSRPRPGVCQCYAPLIERHSSHSKSTNQADSHFVSKTFCCSKLKSSNVYAGRARLRICRDAENGALVKEVAA